MSSRGMPSWVMAYSPLYMPSPLGTYSIFKGVMTNKEAAELKIGGEVLCYVY